MEGVFESIITQNMAMLAAAAISLMLVAGKFPVNKDDKQLNQTVFWKSWGSFILAAICVGGAFLPGTANPVGSESEWGTKVVFGLVATIVAHLGRDILKPIIVRKLEKKD